VDPAAQENQMLINLATRGCTDLMKLALRDPRVNPSDQENEALIAASARQYMDACALIIADPRYIPHARTGIALCNACKFNHVDFVRMLMKQQHFELNYFKAAVDVARKHGNGDALLALFSTAEQDTGRWTVYVETLQVLWASEENQLAKSLCQAEPVKVSNSQLVKLLIREAE
jgi:hypothetical protein